MERPENWFDWMDHALMDSTGQMPWIEALKKEGWSAQLISDFQIDLDDEREQYRLWQQMHRQGTKERNWALVAIIVSLVFNFSSFHLLGQEWKFFFYGLLLIGTLWFVKARRRLNKAKQVDELRILARKGHGKPSFKRLSHFIGPIR